VFDNYGSLTVFAISEFKMFHTENAEVAEI